VKLVDDLRRVIAFRIGSLGYRQYVSGAELNTKTASFTPVIDDMHDTVCNLDAVSIERLSPIRHGSSSPQKYLLLNRITRTLLVMMYISVYQFLISLS
jgi:hypothetical protein